MNILFILRLWQRIILFTIKTKQDCKKKTKKPKQQTCVSIWMLHSLLKFDSLCSFGLICRGNSAGIHWSPESCWWSCWSSHQLEAALPVPGLPWRGGPRWALTFFSGVFQEFVMYPLWYCMEITTETPSLSPPQLLQQTAEPKVFKSLFVIPYDRLLKVCSYPKGVLGDIVWWHPEPGQSSGSGALCAGQEEAPGTASDFEKERKGAQVWNVLYIALLPDYLGWKKGSFSGRWRGVTLVNNGDLLVGLWLIAS